MPLTEDLIKQQESLKTLTEEQVGAVIQLHENTHQVDVKKAVGDALGKVHGDYDRDIEEATGIAKPEGTKSYEHLKTVLKDLKAKAEEAGKMTKGEEALKAAYDKLQGDFNAYKEKSIESADATLRHKLTTTEQLAKDHENTIAKLRGDLTKAEKDKEKILSEKDAAIVVKDLDYAFEKELGKLAFKPGYGQEVVDTLVEAEKARILSEFSPEIAKDAKTGKQSIQFRHRETKELHYNAGNLNNPYTPGELLRERLDEKGALDKGRSQTGAGTKPGEGGGQPTASIATIAAARTRVEADEAINAYLKGQGITTASPKYTDEFQRLRKEHNVAQLP